MTNPSTWTAPNCSSPEEREAASKLYEQGYNINQIAQTIDRSYSTVARWFGTEDTTDYTIKEWKGKAQPEEKENAVKAYKRLGSIPKVCEEVDRSYDTVRRWLKEAGVDCSQKRSKSKKNKCKNRLAELEQENKELRTQARITQLEAEIDELRNIITQFIIN